VDAVLHVGLGADLPEGERLDSLVVRWPDGTESRRRGVAARQRLVLQHPDAGS
jgi:hypothetical protein